MPSGSPEADMVQQTPHVVPDGKGAAGGGRGLVSPAPSVGRATAVSQSVEGLQQATASSSPSATPATNQQSSQQVDRGKNGTGAKRTGARIHPVFRRSSAPGPAPPATDQQSSQQYLGGIC